MGFGGNDGIISKLFTYLKKIRVWILGMRGSDSPVEVGTPYPLLGVPNPLTSTDRRLKEKGSVIPLRCLHSPAIRANTQQPYGAMGCWGRPSK